MAADAVASTRTVLQFAFRQLQILLTSRCTVNHHDISLRAAPESYSPIVAVGEQIIRPGKNGADNQWRRVPASKAACDAVIGVQPHRRNELHVCWNSARGCNHWWPYTARHTPGECAMFANGDCPHCFCPKCGTPRYKSNGSHGTNPRLSYFIHDVIDQFLLHDELCQGIMTARLHPDQKVSSFHRTARCENLRQACIRACYDEKKVSDHDTTRMPLLG